MSRGTAIPTILHVRPAKTRISLCILIWVFARRTYNIAAGADHGLFNGGSKISEGGCVCQRERDVGFKNFPYLLAQYIRTNRPEQTV